MKRFLIILMTVISVNTFATVYPVIAGLSFTTNVTCYIGDTVRFEEPANQSISVALKLTDNSIVFVKQDGSTTTNYTILAPDGNGKLTDYVVQGNEVQYSLNNAYGTFTILTNTNVATGVSNLINAEPTIEVYPNPFVSELRIFSLSDDVVTLFDTVGNRVLSENLVPGENKINVIPLSTGIYYVVVRNKAIKVMRE